MVTIRGVLASPRTLRRRARRELIDRLERHGRLQDALDLRRRWQHRREDTVGRLRERQLARRVGPLDVADAGIVSALGRAVVAVPRPELSVHRLMIDNLELVVGALDRAQIASWLCPIDSTNFYRVGLRDTDRRRAWDALWEAADATWYLRAGGFPHEDVRPMRTLDADTWWPVAERADTWRVYRNYVDPARRSVVGFEHSCQIEFWRPEIAIATESLGPTDPAVAGATEAADPADAGATHVVVSQRKAVHARELDGADGDSSIIGWKARRDNLVSARLPADFDVSSTRTIGDREFATVPGFEVDRHPQTVDFPVDVVYTWVDGNDPAWRRRKEATAAALQGRPFNPKAMSASRFIDRQELRYSLRSLEAFADFVRHVWIVTDDQVPHWLDTSCDRVTVVSHRQLFDGEGRLPTFNSHAIEARLHHIDGLAEHYIYMNDDFFFGRRVGPELFFHRNGAWKFFWSRATIGLGDVSIDDEPVDAAAKNGRRLLHDHFGLDVAHKFKHAPHPQRRSAMFEMERAFKDAFETVWQSQFRSTSDISTAASLIHYFGFATGQAFPATISSAYIDVSGHNLAGQLERLGRRRSVDAWCLNDQESDEASAVVQQQTLHEFFAWFLPMPSAFEKEEVDV